MATMTGAFGGIPRKTSIPYFWLSMNPCFFSGS
jgi:hypothetical protein